MGEQAVYKAIATVDGHKYAIEYCHIVLFFPVPKVQSSIISFLSAHRSCSV